MLHRFNLNKRIDTGSNPVLSTETVIHFIDNTVNGALSIEMNYKQCLSAEHLEVLKRLKKHQKSVQSHC